MTDRFLARGMGASRARSIGRALLFYKVPRRRKLFEPARHTNELEIQDWASCLGSFGFEVDILDRSAEPVSLKRNGAYDLFFGLGTSGSSGNYLHWREESNAPVSALIATTPHPAQANKARLAHLRDFRNRYGVAPSISRLDPSEAAFDDRLAVSDFVMVYGLKDSFAYNSFHGVGPEVLAFGASSIYPRSIVRPEGKNEHFVVLSGSGLIAKGVDLIVETFLGLPQIPLTIFAPDNDETFKNVFGTRIADSPNVTLGGFLSARRRNVLQLASSSASISASPSEGLSSASASMLSWGVPLIATRETGFPVGPPLSLGPFGPATRDRLEEAVVNFLRVAPETRLHMRQEASEMGRQFFRRGFRSNLKSALRQVIPD